MCRSSPLPCVRAGVIAVGQGINEQQELGGKHSSHTGTATHLESPFYGTLGRRLLHRV